MVHLWQYSGNAGIATCSKPLDAATCRFLHTCSEEVSQVLYSQVWDFLKGLCSLLLICSRKLWYSLICLLALERHLKEQHPSLGYQKGAQTSNKNIFKNVQGCRDGSAKNHMN